MIIYDSTVKVERINYRPDMVNINTFYLKKIGERDKHGRLGLMHQIDASNLNFDLMICHIMATIVKKLLFQDKFLI